MKLLTFDFETEQREHVFRWSMRDSFVLTTAFVNLLLVNNSSCSLVIKQFLSIKFLNSSTSDKKSSNHISLSISNNSFIFCLFSKKLSIFLLPEMKSRSILIYLKFDKDEVLLSGDSGMALNMSFW